MADENENPGGSDEENPGGSDEVETPDYADQIKKLRAENAKARLRNKELADKAARLDELEAANKSETEKANDRLTAAEKRAAAAESKLMRLEVAATKGLTPKQASRLRGDTEEELLADADEILEMFGNQKGRPPSGKPAENLKPAGAGDEPPEETNPAKLAASHPRR